MIDLKKTKKVGSAGKFGPRYGRKIRKNIAEIEKSLKERKLCPYCMYKAVKREAAGIWKCRKCGRVFTGGAYTLVTASHKSSERTLKRIVEV